MEQNLRDQNKLQHLQAIQQEYQDTLNGGKKTLKKQSLNNARKTRYPDIHMQRINWTLTLYHRQKLTQNGSKTHT